MKLNKGFVFSFSTILIFSIMVLFSSFYLQKVQRDETDILQSSSIEKAGFVAQDITRDINTLLGTQVDVDRDQLITTISFWDSFPPPTEKLQLIDYQSFVQDRYALLQKASIGLDVSNMVDGKTELFFSNNMRYDFDYSADQNSVYFFRPGSDTQVTVYNINVFVDGAEYDPPAFRPCSIGGSVIVRIYFEDSFGNTESINCTQNPDSVINQVFDFLGETGNLTVSTGAVDSNPNSARIKSTVNNPVVLINTFIQAQIPSPAQEISWYYDADLNYSQSDVNVNRKIELGRS